MKSVFFIIPVYNVKDYLERCIEYVLSQTYDNVRAVLIDDGSTDGSSAICDAFAERNDNLFVTHKSNGGLSDARNAGLNFVCTVADKEDYIAFLDSDDFIRNTFAEKMVGLCETHCCDVAQCAYEKGEKSLFGANSPAPKTKAIDSRQALLGYELKSMSWGKIYKLKLFDGLLFPLNKINEDEFVTYRAVYKSEKVAFTNEKLYYYFQHEASIMSNVARKMKNNPHKFDYLDAYNERIVFFKQNNEPQQIMKTCEKICTDIILRYCEQMYLKKSERDTDCARYIQIYKESFKKMIKRNGIPLKRRLMYILFRIYPHSAVAAGKIFTLRR